MEQDDKRSVLRKPRWYQTRWGRGLIAVVGLAAVAPLWTFLRWYIAPQEPPHRKDLVLAWAAIVAGVAGIGTLYVGWRNMRTSQDNLRVAQENTERTLLNSRKVEEERAMEQSLQAYLENIGKLLTEGKLRPSQTERVGDEQAAEGARTVARAQTLAVLQSLNPGRKRILMRFLYEAELISRAQPVVSLYGADLRRADLKRAYLSDADLTDADLTDAVLTGVKGVTNKELESQARSLEGATIPDGSKHP